MIQLGVVVEGRTEVEFAKQVLTPHLVQLKVLVQPVPISGNVKVGRLANEMAKLYRRFGRVTSLVDFYGFADRPPGVTVDELESRIGEEASCKLDDWRPDRFLPYVQVHEFECLLFSDVDALADALQAPMRVRLALHEIRRQFASPEDINDHPSTAASKRLATAASDLPRRLEGTARWLAARQPRSGLAWRRYGTSAPDLIDG